MDALDVRQVRDSSARMAWNEIRHRARLVKEYGEVPPIHANESRVGQVILNLIVNAAQAMPDGHANDNELRIVTSKDEAGWAVVEVSDTGSGIAPPNLGRIFDPFFTTKPVGVGTGLTLSRHHEVVFVAQAKEALARLEAGERFEVILSDFMMPEITGMELHERVQRIDRDQARRIVFPTGGAFTPASRLFLDAATNPVVEKPFRSADLLSVIDKGRAVRTLSGPKA